MSLLEDAHAELEGDLGEEVEHYPRVQTSSEGDFWQEESEWDRSDPVDTFKGIPMASTSDAELQEAGFSDQVERALRTTYDGVDERDLVKFGGVEYAVDQVADGRLQGSKYVNILGLVRHDE